MQNHYQFLTTEFYPPLMIAVKRNDTNLAKLLIERGADVNNAVPEDSSSCVDQPLHVAIRRDYDMMVFLLLRNNADPNIDMEFNQKPLMVATLENRVGIMKHLIAYGANVNDFSEVEFMKLTCLHVAVNGNFCEAVKSLLEDITIDVNLTTMDGSSALHIAVQRLNHNPTIIQHLLDAGADINLRNLYGRTAFDSLYLYPSDVRKISKEHIVKLSAASLYVSEKNLALIANREEFSEVRNKCMKEIENMKKKKIGDSNFTYYDLLRKSQHNLAVGLKHYDPWKNIDPLVSFPLYGEMINYRLRRVLGRKRLLIDVTDLVYDIFDDIRLPSTFTRMIFKYLTIGDLKKLVVKDN
ncbi:ankyrin repeat and sterile alpha motif domain-containing protein 1B-like [Microplitis mediator]|uniref:ankyrin repeat and sterile alpha motif domain-containing protein 1B-like n=1 Tax=Microplitis mediator TaxID=375433 RepID=UPI00255315C6|nr:ankyrin repeat and sterile alpha motif domain-containing protein 1B-like [Microplitis mediator]